MSNLNVKFIKNAEHIDLVRKNSTKAEYDLYINDETVHLNSRHPFSRYASLTTPESVIDSLKGGHFVVDDGTLKEYRDASYKGFMHNDDFIERFANDNTLLKRASDNIHIAEYGHGGSFDISAGFTWSAFSKNLKTNMEVLRLICSNGLMAKNKLFEREVPIINLFDHHLDIAARQLIDISKSKIEKRIIEMGREHSFVKDVNLVLGHVDRRLTDDPYNSRLINLNNVLNEHADISQFYTKQAITNGIANSLASPISRLDLYNVITELNTHTHEIVDSTETALNRIGTSLLFPMDLDGVINQRINTSTFGSPEQAFFG